MGYCEVKRLHYSEKSQVDLVENENGIQLVRKRLRGIHEVYEQLFRLKHPYLPHIYEVSFEDGATTVIEEFISGQDIGCVGLRRDQAARVMLELCQVLAFLHDRGIIHRDVKPSNLLLAEDGHIRLIDFDAARVVRGEGGPDTVALGTRGYAPPEQYGFSQTDERADIYAVGMTFRTLLVGRMGAYRRVIQTCTESDPQKRYRDIRQVSRAVRWAPLKRWVLAGAAAILLTLAGLSLPLLLRQESSLAREGSRPAVVRSTAEARKHPAPTEVIPAVQTAPISTSESSAPQSVSQPEETVSPPKPPQYVAIDGDGYSISAGDRVVTGKGDSYVYTGTVLAVTGSNQIQVQVDVEIPMLSQANAIYEAAMRARLTGEDYDTAKAAVMDSLNYGKTVFMDSTTCYLHPDAELQIQSSG